MASGNITIEVRTDNAIVSYDTNPSNNPGWTYATCYRWFQLVNDELFEGKLPHCLITMQRKRGAWGYFSPKRFVNIADKADTTDEIALNPAHFAQQGAAGVLATLTHEAAHVWQHHEGHPSRGGYHNREWARKMREIGLMPSSTGKPGGSATGQRMSHYVIKGGPFDILCQRFLASEKTVLFQDCASREAEPIGGKSRSPRAKLASKSCYRCARCGVRAWAKPGVELQCVRCEEQLEVCSTR